MSKYQELEELTFKFKSPPKNVKNKGFSHSALSTAIINWFIL